METPSGAEVLKRYRELKRMSQEELAAAVGKTDGAVWQWENSRTTPRRAVALKLDQLLGAGGEILAGFGYASLAADDEELFSRLDGRYAKLEMAEQSLPELRQLASEVKKLQRRVARLEAAAKPPRRRSTPPSV